eukprot:CAMPEP_0117677194 /NCGR_PEP_ID=MMETSP0804-20121206/16613_1 /TAXON_ID=1074897 /ORGANISM="Tetraselmis astigmatica, Strain CCMP880" /LENGTH=136 /DNA_ID=CAMNT_0005486457 /DNA_START=676 /DNA_END=1083 /DNA_ORIENTATION=-
MASLAILHCSWSLWMLMMTLCPAALYAKVEYYSRIEFLEEELQGTLELPSFVLEHDKLLEDQPLADYGIFATKEQIAQVGLNSSGGSVGRCVCIAKRHDQECGNVNYIGSGLKAQTFVAGNDAIGARAAPILLQEG